MKVSWKYVVIVTYVTKKSTLITSASVIRSSKKVYEEAPIKIMFTMFV